MSKWVAIVQSNYIPWKGYFDLINRVDEFILYDDVQYTRRDWRNRNRIKTPKGVQWLTIPVQVKGKYFQAIREVEVSNFEWANSHWKSLYHNYKPSPFFAKYSPYFEQLYATIPSTFLSEINYQFIRLICKLLEIETAITWSMAYQIEGIEDPTDRLISLCQQAGATHYLSGPLAKNYMDEIKFREAGIELHYMDYGGYPEYQQLYGPFEHAVTVLDLLFNIGDNAQSYMLSFGG